MARKKITYKKQEKKILALTVFGHGNSSYYWSIGNDPNIVHATRAARAAKRDHKLFAWQIMLVHIFDISDCENWAFDGYSVVNTDKQDKESEAYKKGDIYNPYRGCELLKKIETLEVVL